jgi:hypothetical protein
MIHARVAQDGQRLKVLVRRSSWSRRKNMLCVGMEFLIQVKFAMMVTKMTVITAQIIALSIEFVYPMNFAQMNSLHISLLEDRRSRHMLWRSMEISIRPTKIRKYMNDS